MSAYNLVESMILNGMVEGQMHGCIRDAGRLAGGYVASGALSMADANKLGAVCEVCGAARKRMEIAGREWKHVRTIEVRNGNGDVTAVWRVFATNDPGFPLSVDFEGKVHKYMAAKRLSALISRKMFKCVRGRAPTD